jgi:hypothetical protein
MAGPEQQQTGRHTNLGQHGICRSAHLHPGRLAFLARQLDSQAGIRWFRLGRPIVPSGIPAPCYLGQAGGRASRLLPSPRPSLAQEAGSSSIAPAPRSPADHVARASSPRRPRVGLLDRSTEGSIQPPAQTPSRSLPWILSRETCIIQDIDKASRLQ